METIGKYNVIKELGAGGFGAVYLAEDSDSHEQVAIKVFRPRTSVIESLSSASAGSDAETIEVLKQRFLNEAKLLRQLEKSPFIMQRYELDRLEDGSPWYAMPYLPNSLRKALGSDATEVNVIRDLPDEDKPRKLPLNQVVSIVEQLLCALADVHRLGKKNIVHRDITTSNVLLDEHGDVKLSDFGIAKLPDFEGSSSNVVMGNGDYRSPEQKQSTKHVDQRSDVYSTGVVIYRMVCGTMPEGRYADPLAYTPQIGEDFNGFILKAMEPKKERRFVDGGEMLRQFREIKKALSGSTGAEEGTDVDAKSQPSIKTELQPLHDKITGFLTSEGEISTQHSITLEALAAVAGLTTEELQEFIRRIEDSLQHELQPFRNWLALLETKAQSQGGNLDPMTQDAILEAGSALGKTEQQLQERIVRVCSQYQQDSEANATSEGKPAPVTQLLPADDRTDKKDSSATAQPAKNDVKTGKSVIPTTSKVSPETITDKTPASPAAFPVKKALVATGIVLALGMGVVFYQQNKDTGFDQATTDRKTTASDTAAAMQPARLPAVQALLDSMVDIPGGSFMMGWNDGPDDEKLVHRVTLQPFRLMEHEVTFAMWDACVADGGCSHKPDDEGWGRGRRPVIKVSWKDISNEFIPWLNNETGEKFRLPSEAEWEYAARAGSTNKYSWGENISCSQARYGQLFEDVCGDENKTVLVKSYQPNQFGLYDMHGNVGEWTQDCWNDSYEGAPFDGSAWRQGNCDQAALRGGSWFDTPLSLRSFHRFWNDRTSRNNNLGMRLALDR